MILYKQARIAGLSNNFFNPSFAKALGVTVDRLINGQGDRHKG